jgi:hypothetical protein
MARRSALPPLARYAPLAALLALGALSACATQSAAGVSPAAPGFLLGLWHGFIFPIAWLLSLFMPEVSVYAVPNNGGWYDFGYFCGIVFLGVGARKSKIVYRYRVVREGDARQPGARTVEGSHTIRRDGDEA